VGSSLQIFEVLECEKMRSAASTKKWRTSGKSSKVITAAILLSVILMNGNTRGESGWLPEEEVCI
jgi:hypothetical protein